MDSLTVTSLRNNIYRVLDTIIKSGTAQKIKRKGHTIRIEMEEKIDKFSQLIPHKTITGHPEELINLKVNKWHELKNL